MEVSVQVSALQVLPLFFRLFKCQDKSLRQLVFRHIIAGMQFCMTLLENALCMLYDLNAVMASQATPFLAIRASCLTALQHMQTLKQQTGSTRMTP